MDTFFTDSLQTNLNLNLFLFDLSLISVIDLKITNLQTAGTTKEIK